MSSFVRPTWYLILVLAFLMGLVNSQAAFAEAPSLIKDLNTTLDEVDYDSLKTLGNKLIMFMNEHAGHGKEYFTSDGTIEGTHALADVVAGTAGIYSQNYNRLASDNNTVNFSGRRLDILSATNSYGQYGLWSSDGTSTNTSKLLDFADTSDAPEFLGSFGSMQFLSVQTNISGTYSTKIWKTDGTTAGTVAVKELCTESNCWVYPVGSIGTSYLFVVSSTAGGLRVWKTDGTSAGTVAVKSLGAVATQSFGVATVSGSKAFIVVRDSSTSYSRLWSSDGTSGGTVQVTNVTYVSGGTTYRPDEWGGISQLIPGAAGEVYFRAIFDDYSAALIFRSQGTNATTVNISPAGSLYNEPGVYFGSAFYFSGDAGTGMELLKYTSGGGTVLLKDIFPGQGDDDGQPYQYSGYPTKFVVAGSHFAFIAGSMNGDSLWKSDGTTVGTVEVKSFGDIDNNGYVYSQLIKAPTGIYFTVQEDLPNRGIWYSDLTSGGTRKVLSLIDGDYVYILPTPSIAYFVVTEGDEPGLYRSDSTANGTIALKPFKLSNTRSSSVSISPKIRNKVLLSSYSLSSLTVTDGLTANTRELHNSQGEELSNTRDITKIVVNNLEYATFIDSSTLYLSDMTDAGTRAVLTPEQAGVESFRGISVISNSKKGVIFSSYYDQSNYFYKLISYSFENGTHTTISTFAGSGLNLDELYLEWTIAGDSGVYFLLSDYSNSPSELWYSDGTGANTRRLLTQNDFGNNFYSGRIVVGNRLFFSGTTTGAGNELWTSDGTIAGSKMVIDLNPGTSSSYPGTFLQLNNQFYFYAYTGTESGFWRSDGSAAGTTLAIPSNVTKPGPEYLYPYGTPAEQDGALYFACQRVLCVSSCTTMYGLCRSFGTSQTTNFITALPRASYESSVQLVKPEHSSDLYFAVQDAPSYSDGYIGKLTGSTFTPLSDLTGSILGASTDISNMTAVGDNIVFTAYTDAYGNEPWAIVRDECTEDPGKTAPGSCGCGIPDIDSDGDTVLDCSDNCDFDPTKTVVGACGCGIPDIDTNGNGIPDCLDPPLPPAPNPVPTIAPPAIPPLTAPTIKADKKKKGTYTITAKLVPGFSYVFLAEMQTGTGKKIKWKRAVNKTVAQNTLSTKLKAGKYRISYSIGGKVSPLKNFTAK